MSAERRKTIDLDRNAGLQRLMILVLRKLHIVLISLLFLSGNELRSWPLIQKESEQNQILRFRFQDGNTSVQIYALLYAPAFGLSGGAGMVVSIVHDGEHTTGGYHYIWNDVELTEELFSMGPHSVQMNRNRFFVQFQSRDVALSLRADRMETVPEKGFSIDRKGNSLLSIEGREFAPDSAIDMTLYGKRIRLRGNAMIDHWKLSRDLPDDVGSIRITTSLNEKPILLAQSSFPKGTDTYVQYGQTKNTVLFQNRATGAEPLDWPYESKCRLRLHMGPAVHILDQQTIPSTSRLLGFYLGKRPRIVSYRSVLWDKCGDSSIRVPAETTIVTLE